ncbi:MAG: hypothetical protein M0R32_12155 [Candidatus Cloacimonetes bacterium]|jgi:hypothetical protein|nr:hypothetical protein [Candidatus Cloacimonadota bacterium]
MKFKEIIWWLGIGLTISGGFGVISYMFEFPKLSQFYLIDIDYWKRMIVPIVGIVMILLAGSQDS